MTTVTIVTNNMCFKTLRKHGIRIFIRNTCYEQITALQKLRQKKP